ncbi:MAG: hypothetical protein JWO13_735 [Acidobacteriales bacterium]|nr:hypothetical protein [Terriglobales bacterium]
MPHLQDFGLQSIDSIAPWAKFLILLVKRCGNAIQKSAADLGIDAMRNDGVHDFVQCVEAGAVGVEGGDVDVAAFKFMSAMLVVEMAVSGITQRRGLALVSVDFEVNAGAEGHS